VGIGSHPSTAVASGPVGYRASYSCDAAGDRIAEGEYGSNGATLDCTATMTPDNLIKLKSDLTHVIVDPEVP
jgi:hypothetical protein